MTVVVPWRMIVRVAATCLIVLLVSSSPGIAQIGGIDPREARPSDIELRRRLEPQLPAIREGLLGKSPDAQRAALAMMADVPPALAAGANLTTALSTYLQRPDLTDPELIEIGVRSFGKTFPDAPDIGKVLGRHSRSGSVAVRRAAADAVAAVITNAAPAGRSVANSAYFIDVCKQAIPVLSTTLEDKDGATQRYSLAGVQAASRFLTEIYAFDSGPLVEEPKAKGDADRLAPLGPVIQELAAVVPKMASPLLAAEAETRTAAARTLEGLALLRRTILQSNPGQVDPFAGSWPAIRQAVIAQIKDRSPAVRLAMTEALESLGDAVQARVLLREAAADSNPFVRWTAARALGRSVPANVDPTVLEADVAALEPLTRDTDMDVRMAGLNALASLGVAARTATPSVVAAAGRGDVEPRVIAIKALGSIESDAKATVPLLIASLRDRDIRVRRAAALGLVRFGPDARAALPELRRALADEDTELRLAAGEAILAIERKPRLRDL